MKMYGLSLLLVACSANHVVYDVQDGGTQALPDADRIVLDAPIAAYDALPVDAQDFLTQTVSVPGGSFFMGCNSTDDGCFGETPRHSVLVDDFIIDRFEISQAKYQNCMAVNACSEPASNWDPINNAELPVTDVTWHQADDYCRWANGSLPTEAQWEKAARGADGRAYPWGVSAPSCGLANYGGCTGSFLPVGALAAGRSPVGAMNMAGNVTEWVNDWWDVNYYTQGNNDNPLGPLTGVSKVIRGGSAYDTDFWIYTFRRDRMNPETSDFGTGFRCVY